MKKFLSIIPDLDLLLIRLTKFSLNQYSKISLKDCYSIYLFIVCLQELMTFMSNHSHTTSE